MWWSRLSPIVNFFSYVMPTSNNYLDIFYSRTLTFQASHLVKIGSSEFYSDIRIYIETPVRLQCMSMETVFLDNQWHMKWLKLLQENTSRARPCQHLLDYNHTSSPRNKSESVECSNESQECCHCGRMSVNARVFLYVCVLGLREELLKLFEYATKCTTRDVHGIGVKKLQIN